MLDAVEMPWDEQGKERQRNMSCVKQAHVVAGVRVPKESRRQRRHDVPVDDDALHRDAAFPGDELVAERLVAYAGGRKCHGSDDHPAGQRRRGVGGVPRGGEQGQRAAEAVTGGCHADAFAGVPVSQVRYQAAELGEDLAARASTHVAGVAAGRVQALEPSLHLNLRTTSLLPLPAAMDRNEDRLQVLQQLVQRRRAAPHDRDVPVADAVALGVGSDGDVADPVLLVWAIVFFVYAAAVAGEDVDGSVEERGGDVAVAAEAEGGQQVGEGIAAGAIVAVVGVIGGLGELAVVEDLAFISVHIFFLSVNVCACVKVY